MVIVDTSVLLASLDAADGDHARCSSLLIAFAAREALVVPSTVLVELAYWVVERLGHPAWNLFVGDLLRGAYVYEQVTLADIRRANEVDQQYEALRLGLVDASLVAVCERLGENRLATLNERDFRPVVPRHCTYLKLLPADL
jgi:uncharacterized protein